MAEARSISPRLVVAVPAYDSGRWLPEALETLLGQSVRELAVVVRFDGDPGAALAVVEGYARHDPRLTVVHGGPRLGLVGNWQRVLEISLATHPDAEYVAWGSDHDAWHPRWAAELTAALDREPEAVLAYPLNQRIDGAGRVLIHPWRFDLRHADSAARVRAAARGMRAGDMIYGVMRRSALPGLRFERVLVPDRLFLAQLAARGGFVQVHQVLWRRRFVHAVTARRQRRSIFPQGAPARSYLPWWMPHAACIARTVARRELAPEAPLAVNARVAAIYTAESARIHARGRVNFGVGAIAIFLEWIAREVEAPRNVPIGLTLRAARATWRLLHGHPI